MTLLTFLTIRFPAVQKIDGTRRWDTEIETATTPDLVAGGKEAKKVALLTKNRRNLGRNPTYTNPKQRLQLRADDVVQVTLGIPSVSHAVRRCRLVSARLKASCRNGRSRKRTLEDSADRRRSQPNPSNEPTETDAPGNSAHLALRSLDVVRRRTRHDQLLRAADVRGQEDANGIRKNNQRKWTLNRADA